MVGANYWKIYTIDIGYTSCTHLSGISIIFSLSFQFAPSKLACGSLEQNIALWKSFKLFFEEKIKNS